MNILVSSRKSIETDGLTRFGQCVIISIATPGNPAARIPRTANVLDVLFLAFYDIDQPFQLLDGSTAEPMTASQAAEVAAFVTRWSGSVETIICQCEAGISRSAGIAAAIAKRLTGDDRYYFGEYIPNRTCYARVLDSLGAQTHGPHGCEPVVCHMRRQPGKQECLEMIWSEGRACRRCQENCYRRGWTVRQVAADNRRIVNGKR